jgi:hypothetical protein
MLSQMLKQHQETIKGRNETQEKLKRECVESANELTVNLVSCLIFCLSAFNSWSFENVLHLKHFFSFGL